MTSSRLLLCLKVIDVIGFCQVGKVNISDVQRTFDGPLYLLPLEVCLRLGCRGWNLRQLCGGGRWPRHGDRTLLLAGTEALLGGTQHATQSRLGS